METAIATLVLGFIAGWLGQRSRMCFIGGYRDYILVRDTALIKGSIAFFLSAWATLNLASLLHAHFGLPAGGPFPAAGSYPVLSPAMLGESFAWISLAGGFGLGFFTTLSDACPLRHHILAGQGRGDSLLFIAGLLAGIAAYYSWL